MKIAVIGTGSVGGTLGSGWAKAGHDVVFGSRDPGSSKVRSLIKLTENKAKALPPTEAIQDADAIVIATPWGVTESTIRSLGGLKNRLVIDCTNPLDGMTLAVGLNDSGGERVATWARGAKVVKAFNCTGYNVMANPAFGKDAAAMFICGDNAEANATVVALASELGFDAVDAGPLRAARYLEPLAGLWIHLAYGQGMGREIAFSLLKR